MISVIREHIKSSFKNAGLRLTEHDDIFDTEEISHSKLKNKYQIEFGDVVTRQSNISLSDSVPVTISAMFKGSSPIETYDSGMTSMLIFRANVINKQKINNKFINVVPGGFSTEPLNEGNDRYLKIKLDLIFEVANQG